MMQCVCMLQDPMIVTFLQAHDVGIGKQFSELMKEFKELKFPTVPAQFLTPFDPNTD